MEVLGWVFSDICGLMETSKVKGFHYSITFTNDYSQFTYISFCKTKDNALAAFKTWKACAEKETGKSLKILCMDRGGKYTSTTFNSFLAECGIKHETTNAYTQENGVSEHVNCTINTLAQSLLADVKEVLKEKALPMALWSLAVTHAVMTSSPIVQIGLPSGRLGLSI